MAPSTPHDATAGRRTHEALGPPRWRGQAGRLEVWYLTATDPRTGTGLWLHHEVVAPTDGAPAYAHGWVALFPPDREPVWERFGPEAPGTGGGPEVWFAAGGATVSASRMAGDVDGARWELACTTSGARPLWTFPAVAWEREVLPAAQVLAAPDMVLSGPVQVGGVGVDLDGAPAGSARIYGHGNAKRWGWLHADLGGGDVLEVVSAVSMRPGLRALPPASFVQLRWGGRDLPRVPLAPGKVTLALPTWTMRAHAGRHRIRTVVELPPDRSIAVGYVDPSGETATCTNSERASAEITVERFDGRWRTLRAWTLDGTAHSEVGLRP
jgi:hypothetical protein